MLLHKISIIFVLLSSKTLLTGNTKLSKKKSIPDTKRRKEENLIPFVARYKKVRVFWEMLECSNA